MAEYPPHPLPPILPTHSSSLALHLLGLNGSWECCDVMQWCTERTASLCFFFPSSFTGASDSQCISNDFPFRPCPLTASFLLKSGVHQSTGESEASRPDLLQGRALGVRRGTEVHSTPRPAAVYLWAETWNVPALLAYFVLF